MDNQTLHKNIIEILQRMYPQRNGLTQMLIDSLNIKKEAVYRRLRGEVFFSLSEVAIISNKTGLSLDGLIDYDLPKSISCRLMLTEHANTMNPSKIDYTMLEEIVGTLRKFKNEPETEGGEATNSLPQAIYLKYESISKFYIFKWRCFYENSNRSVSYNEIVIPDRLRELQLGNALLSRHLSSTIYILDHYVFIYLVNDIKYFREIGLITNEEAQLIKQDLLSILNDLEKITQDGHFSETGNKVNIYISNVNFSNSYCYLNTPTHRITLLKTFILNVISSIDSKIFDEITLWINSLKRQSILITQSAERHRIAFFSNQRANINNI